MLVMRFVIMQFPSHARSILFFLFISISIKLIIKTIVVPHVQMLAMPSAALLQPRVSKSALASTQAGLQETMTCHRYPNIHPNIQIFQISIQIQSAAESVKASTGLSTSWSARNNDLTNDLLHMIDI